MKRIFLTIPLLTILACCTFAQNSGMPENMTVEQFNTRIKAQKLVLVNFSADWCVVCKRQKPVLDELREAKKASVEVLEIDMKANPLIAEYFEVDGLPVNILYQNGNMVWIRMGFKGTGELLEVISLYE